MDILDDILAGNFTFDKTKIGAENLADAEKVIASGILASPTLDSNRGKAAFALAGIELPADAAVKFATQETQQATKKLQDEQALLSGTFARASQAGLKAVTALSGDGLDEFLAATNRAMEESARISKEAYAETAYTAVKTNVETARTEISQALARQAAVVNNINSNPFAAEAFRQFPSLGLKTPEDTLNNLQNQALKSEQILASQLANAKTEYDRLVGQKTSDSKTILKAAQLERQLGIYKETLAIVNIGANLQAKDYAAKLAPFETALKTAEQERDAAIKLLTVQENSGVARAQIKASSDEKKLLVETAKRELKEQQNNQAETVVGQISDSLANLSSRLNRDDTPAEVINEVASVKAQLQSSIAQVALMPGVNASKLASINKLANDVQSRLTFFQTSKTRSGFTEEELYKKSSAARALNGVEVSSKEISDAVLAAKTGKDPLANLVLVSAERKLSFKEAIALAADKSNAYSGVAAKTFSSVLGVLPQEKFAGEAIFVENFIKQFPFGVPEGAEKAAKEEHPKLVKVIDSKRALVDVGTSAETMAALLSGKPELAAKYAKFLDGDNREMKLASFIDASKKTFTKWTLDEFAEIALVLATDAKTQGQPVTDITNSSRGAGDSFKYTLNTIIAATDLEVPGVEYLLDASRGKNIVIDFANEKEAKARIQASKNMFTQVLLRPVR